MTGEPAKVGNDAGLMELTKLPKLQQLTIKGQRMKITPAGVAALQKAMP